MVDLVLDVGLAGQEGTPDVADLTRALSAELEELGVELRPLDAGPVPVGAKGDPITIGAIAVAVLPTLIPKLLDFLKSWLDRDRERTVTVKAVVGGKPVELSFPANRHFSGEELARVLAPLRE